MLRRAVYHGSNHLLLGKTALVELRNDQTLFAQFDDMALPFAGDDTDLPYGFGWHAMPRSDFTLYPCAPAA